MLQKSLKDRSRSCPDRINFLSRGNLKKQKKIFFSKNPCTKYSAQNRIFRNRSRRFSMPSAQLRTSLGPSKSLIRALFNGSKLDFVTARGAKNGIGQNRRKSQKNTESQT